MTHAGPYILHALLSNYHPRGPHCTRAPNPQGRRAAAGTGGVGPARGGRPRAPARAARRLCPAGGPGACGAAGQGVGGVVWLHGAAGPGRARVWGFGLVPESRVWGLGPAGKGKAVPRRAHTAHIAVLQRPLHTHAPTQRQGVGSAIAASAAQPLSVAPRCPSPTPPAVAPHTHLPRVPSLAHPRPRLAPPQYLQQHFCPIALPPPPIPTHTTPNPT